MSFRPSSLPMLSKCGGFVSGPSEYTDAGTGRHLLFAASIKFRLGQITEPELAEIASGYDDADVESVAWATDYFWSNAQHGQYPVAIEQTLSGYTEDIEELAGTPDVSCFRDYFDLKSRHRDYRAQMAAYVVLLCQQNPDLKIVNVHLLFTETRRSECYSLTQEEAMVIVMEIKNNPRPLQRNEYCDWCAHLNTCPAILSDVRQVADGYDDERKLSIEQWHPSRMKDPEQIARGYHVARVVAKWAESMKFHALERAREGMILPGLDVKQTSGSREVTNPAEAFAVLDIPQDVYMRCADIRLNTSKEHAHRLGLIDAYKECHPGITKAQSAREVAQRLGPLLVAGKDKFTLTEAD